MWISFLRVCQRAQSSCQVFLCSLNKSQSLIPREFFQVCRHIVTGKRWGRVRKSLYVARKKIKMLFPLMLLKRLIFLCLSMFSFPLTGLSNLQWTVFTSETQAAIPQAVLGKPLTDVRFTQWVGFIYVFLKSSILGESLSGKNGTRSTSSQ